MYGSKYEKELLVSIQNKSLLNNYKLYLEPLITSNVLVFNVWFISLKVTSVFQIKYCANKYPPQQFSHIFSHVGR